MTDNEKKSNSAEGVWRLCLAQAHEFIKAAEQLAATESFPHIVHHLSLLALEEIGKGNMVGASAISNQDSPWAEKALESHIRKLQWALWTPMTRIDPKDFADAKVLARDMHELRLSSLYVDPNSDLTELPPNKKITAERANAWLNVARSRLKLEEAHGLPSGEPDDLLKWFLDTMASDDRSKKYLLSKGFTDKYEMGADARAWASWAREEIDKIEREGAEILQAELARKAAPDGEHKPRWRAKATVYTPSHSIKSKILNLWNDKLGEVVEFVYTGKKDSFDLRLTLHDNTGITELNARATHLAKLSVACRNLGSIGYFWFQRPGYEQQLFREIEDFEHIDKTLLMEKPRPSFWGTGRAVALTEQHISHALECMLAFMPLTEAEALPIFRPYYDGLALVAKSDEYYSFDEMARQAFGASLGGALHEFAGWDGTPEKFAPTFHTAFTPFMPEKEHRDQMLHAISPQKPDPELTLWESLRSTKQMADLYLINVARRKWLERFEKK